MRRGKETAYQWNQKKRRHPLLWWIIQANWRSMRRPMLQLDCYHIHFDNTGKGSAFSCLRHCYKCDQKLKGFLDHNQRPPPFLHTSMWYFTTALPKRRTICNDGHALHICCLTWVASSQRRLLSIWNVTSVTEELNFSFHLI